MSKYIQKPERIIQVEISPKTVESVSVSNDTKVNKIPYVSRIFGIFGTAT